MAIAAGFLFPVPCSLFPVSSYLTSPGQIRFGIFAGEDLLDEGGRLRIGGIPGDADCLLENSDGLGDLSRCAGVDRRERLALFDSVADTGVEHDAGMGIDRLPAERLLGDFGCVGR